MYIPAAFAVDRPETLHRIVREHPLGTLVTHGDDGFDAEHLPFEFDPATGPLGTLTGHVARANGVWRRAPTGTRVLVIFHGAEAYVSPNWYPSKHETHRLVPTWNYEVVHAHGVVTVRDDERFVRGLVARLTRQHEAEAGEARPWKMTDSTPEFIDSLLANIVGLEIAVTSLVGKAKLGQNREERDRLGAAARLDGQGHGELAALMRDAGA